MSSRCTFNLNRKSEVYFAGEDIEGTITLKTTKDKNIRDMVIRMDGNGKVLWDEVVEFFGDFSNTEILRHAFQAQERYISEFIDLYDDFYLLKAGTYNYNFKFNLKPNCSTSCEGEVGNIRYELSLVINKVNGEKNVFSKALTVIKHLDLNMNPTYTISPIELASNKVVCPCFCGLLKSNLYFSLQIPFCAYAPGQIMKCTLKIHNKTRGCIQNCTLQLMKKMTFTAQHPGIRKRKTNMLAASKLIPGELITSEGFQVEIPIPATCPTTEETSIICVRYYLIALMDYSCCVNTTMKAKTEIIIGTVPLRETLAPDQFFSSDEQQQELSSEAEDQDPVANLPPNCKDIRPPTFIKDQVFTPLFSEAGTTAMDRVPYFRPSYPIYKVSLNSNQL